MLAQGQTHGRERPVPGEARLRRAGRGMRSVCGVESGGGEDGRIRRCRRPSAYSLLPEGGGELVPRAQSASRPPLSMRVLGETAPGGLRIRARDTEPRPHLVPPQDMEPCPVSLRSAHSPCWPEEGVMSGHCPDPGRQAAGGLQEGRSLSAGTADLDRPDRRGRGAQHVSPALFWVWRPQSDRSLWRTLSHH